MTAKAPRLCLYNQRYPMLAGLLVAESLRWDDKRSCFVWGNPVVIGTATEALVSASKE